MAIYGQPEHEIFVDINSYLIEEYPILTWAQRNSIGHLCVNDEEFDLDPIYDQIDTWVAYYAEQQGIEIPYEDDDDDSEESSED